MEPQDGSELQVIRLIERTAWHRITNACPRCSDSAGQCILPGLGIIRPPTIHGAARSVTYAIPGTSGKGNWSSEVVPIPLLYQIAT